MRRRDPSEVSKQSNTKFPKTGVQMSCRKCGQFGHNARTCKAEGPAEAPPQPKPPGKCGRPRKNLAEGPPNPHTSEQAVQRREKRLGYGVRVFTKTGNIYIRQQQRVNLVTSQVEGGSSQASQVVDGSAPSPAC